MTVFKAFWQIVNKYKGTVILYTVLLIVFGGLNMSANDNQMSFVASKPDILIVNEDEEIGLTKNLINYIEDNSNIIEVEKDPEKIDDALFYRDVNYVIYLPKNYRNDVLNGLNPKIDIKSTGDYSASLAELMLSRYIKTQNVYVGSDLKEDEIIDKINTVLDNKTNIEITSKLDTTKTTNATSYFNFASYSIMAVVIFIVCLVLTSFHNKNVNKRTIASSMNFKHHNRLILFSSFIYSVIAWALFVILGAFLNKDVMFSTRGLIYMANSFVFTFCSLTIALLISSLVNNKDAVSGIVNVIALGSAFLCGAFVPAEWLPDSVLKIAHALPAYWYINSNDLLKNMEVINFSNLKPVFLNIFVIIIFSIVFIIFNNFILRKKRRMD